MPKSAVKRTPPSKPKVSAKKTAPKQKSAQQKPIAQSKPRVKVSVSGEPIRKPVVRGAKSDVQTKPRVKVGIDGKPVRKPTTRVGKSKEAKPRTKASTSTRKSAARGTRGAPNKVPAVPAAQRAAASAGKGLAGKASRLFGPVGTAASIVHAGLKKAYDDKKQQDTYNKRLDEKRKSAPKTNTLPKDVGGGNLIRKMSGKKERPKPKKVAAKQTPPKQGKKKLSKFGSAFAAARKAGKSTFEWNGKKYTTEMKGEKKKAGKSKPNQSKAPSPQKKAVAPKGPTKAPAVKGVFKKKGPDAKALAAKRKARGDLK